MSCNIDNSSDRSSDLKDSEPDLPEGVPPLRSLYLYISGSCNLACRHCWITPTYQARGNGGRFIKLEHVEKAIREARPLGLRTVKLTGGEPMLHPQFKEIVRLIDDEDLNIQIETNGTLIDDDLAKFLKQTERVSFVSVSVDGAEAESHEYMRGVPGCFESAVDGIRKLVKQGFRPQLICTLHKGNTSELEKVIELAGTLGCGSVKFNHVQQVGRGEQFSEEKGLKVPEIISLYQRIENDLIPKSKIPLHFDIPFAFYPIRKLLDDQLGRCTVRNILGILSGGELSLCGIGVSIPELIYGQIEKDSLREVWCNNPGLVQLREEIPERLEGICGDCLHRDLCLGHCVANNFHVSGKLNVPYQFCYIAEQSGLFPASRKRIIAN